MSMTVVILACLSCVAPPEIPELKPPVWEKLDEPVAARLYSFSGSRDAVSVFPQVELPANVMIGLTASQFTKRSIPEQEPNWNSMRKSLGVIPISCVGPSLTLPAR